MRLWLAQRLSRVLYQVIFWLYPSRETIPPLQREGKFASFNCQGTRFNETCWVVRSRRGGFELGWIEWSPQWGAYSFRAHPEARFNGQLVAEIYTFLKERGQATGRFV